MSILNTSQQALERRLIGDQVTGFDLHNQPRATETECPLSGDYIHAAVAPGGRNANLIALRTQDSRDQLGKGMTCEIGGDVPFDVVTRDLRQIRGDIAGLVND